MPNVLHLRLFAAKRTSNPLKFSLRVSKFARLSSILRGSRMLKCKFRMCRMSRKVAPQRPRTRLVVTHLVNKEILEIKNRKILVWSFALRNLKFELHLKQIEFARNKTKRNQKVKPNLASINWRNKYHSLDIVQWTIFHISVIWYHTTSEHMESFYNKNFPW